MIWYRLARELPSTPATGSVWLKDWAVGSAVVPLDDRLAPGVRAWVSSLNPLADPPPSTPPAGPVVLRSGWSTDDRPAWMPGGRESLDAFLRAIPAGAEVWLWPAADHALSDVPSIAGFLRRHAQVAGGPRVRLLFDPASLLAPSMLARADDHLSRMFEALAAHPSTGAILLANIAPGSDIEGSRLTPWHAGAIGVKVLADLLRAHAPPDAAIVLMDDRVNEQAWALAAMGLGAA